MHPKKRTIDPKAKTRSLFSRPSETEKITIPMDMDTGVFYPVDGTYWCLIEKVLEGQTVDVTPYDLGTYFTVHQFRIGRNTIGYRFAGENIHSGGVFLSLRKSDEPAISFRLVCRNRHMVVYEYPNAGAIVVLPQLGEKIREIILEQ